MTIREYRFDALKNKAKKEVSRRLSADDAFIPQKGAYNASALLEAMPEVIGRHLGRERPVDELAGGMRQQAEAVVRDWETEAHRLIDRWDVRRVGALIEALPEIVPAKYRNPGAVVEIEDRDNAAGDGSEWVVTLDSEVRPAQESAGDMTADEEHTSASPGPSMG